MDDADLAQRHSDAALARALGRRAAAGKAGAARICTVCGEPIAAAELAEDPDTLTCGRHARAAAEEMA
jgi:hypothetical protein